MGLWPAQVSPLTPDLRRFLFLHDDAGSAPLTSAATMPSTSRTRHGWPQVWAFSSVMTRARNSRQRAFGG
jgi:hypothetical protein